jgi:hypothetical protein
MARLTKENMDSLYNAVINGEQTPAHPPKCIGCHLDWPLCDCSKEDNGDN